MRLPDFPKRMGRYSAVFPWVEELAFAVTRRRSCYG